MLTLALLLALALGWCAGGRLARFEGACLRFLPLPPLALVLQALPARLSPQTYDGWGWLLIPASYLLLLLFLLGNRHLKKTALLLGTGSFCNLLVIALNSWRMPVSPSAASLLSAEGLAALASGQIPMYALAGSETRLLLLGDIFYCPIPLFRGFASVGDFLLAAGVFLCLMAVMAPPRLPSWLRSG